MGITNPIYEMSPTMYLFHNQIKVVGEQATFLGMWIRK